MKVIIDTSVLLAYQVKSDVNHVVAEKLFKKFHSIFCKLYVSDYILDEFYTRVLYDYGVKAAQTCVKVTTRAIATGAIALIQIDQDLFPKVQDAYIKLADKGLSFTDVSTYIFYKDYKLDEICTFDSHFRKVGAKVSLL